jgi:uroporphyrinogen III methyltransferase/synthase
VVGEVVRLSERLHWFDGNPGPLQGRTVAVTRARSQASELANRLQRLGAQVVQAPVIRIQALDGRALDPSGYDLVCLTSPNGVDAFFTRLAAGGRDARSLAACRVGAIGPGTARALSRHGIIADIVPERFVAEGLIDALDEQALQGSAAPLRRALVARAAEARDVLPAGLRARGLEVDVVDLYETLAEPLSEPLLSAAREADYITFTSSSTVRFFFASLGPGIPLSPSTRVVSIGPITSQTLREHGVEPHVEASQHDIDGLVAALSLDAARGGTGHARLSTDDSAASTTSSQ